MSGGNLEKDYSYSSAEDLKRAAAEVSERCERLVEAMEKIKEAYFELWGDICEAMEPLADILKGCYFEDLPFYDKPRERFPVFNEKKSRRIKKQRPRFPLVCNDGPQ